MRTILLVVALLVGCSNHLQEPKELVIEHTDLNWSFDSSEMEWCIDHEINFCDPDPNTVLAEMDAYIVQLQEWRKVLAEKICLTVLEPTR